jgi:hypothetical protein
MYARTRDLQSLLRRLFLQYGDIFVLSLFSQKIVFLKDTRVRRYYWPWVFHFLVHTCVFRRK